MRRAHWLRQNRCQRARVNQAKMIPKLQKHWAKIRFPTVTNYIMHPSLVNYVIAVRCTGIVPRAHVTKIVFSRENILSYNRTGENCDLRCGGAGIFLFLTVIIYLYQFAHYKRNRFNFNVRNTRHTRNRNVTRYLDRPTDNRLIYMSYQTFSFFFFTKKRHPHMYPSCTDDNFFASRVLETTTKFRRLFNQVRS